MELMIFGFVSLVTLAIFCVLSLLPAALAFYIGRRFQPRYLRWLFAGLAITIPLIWGTASYFTFKSECDLVPKQEFVSHPASVPNSIWISAKSVDAADLIERGMFSLIEEDFRGTEIHRYIAEQKQTRDSPIVVRRDYVPITEARSEYRLTEKEVRLDRWWSPPIFIATFTVEEKRSGRKLAEARELVFGGGIVGEYLRILGGDQDFDRLSCGYASRDIGAWRPTLTSRPRFKQYKDADAEFLSHALDLHPKK